MRASFITTTLYLSPFITAFYVYKQGESAGSIVVVEKHHHANLVMAETEKYLTLGRPTIYSNKEIQGGKSFGRPPPP